MDLWVGTAIAVAEDENGMLGVQVDGFGDNPTGHGRYHIGVYGLISKPLPASKDGLGPGVLYGDEGAEGFAWIGFDPRDLEKVPVLSLGSSGLVNSRGSYIAQDYESETTTIVGKRANGTKQHKITIGDDGNGGDVITIEHWGGPKITMTDDEITVSAPTVHVNSPNVRLGSSPGKAVATVGDGVAVTISAASIAAMVAPGAPPALTAIGKILSGRSGLQG
jgi:hypothetical protein